MSMNRILVLAAVVCFALVALSAFSTSINLNEVGWTALGLAAWAGASLVVGLPLTTGRRHRVLR